MHIIIDIRSQRNKPKLSELLKIIKKQGKDKVKFVDKLALHFSADYSKNREDFKYIMLSK